MSTDQTKTSGTEGQDDGTQLEQAAGTGTPEPENRNAESGEDWKKLAISLQEKAAKVNDLEAQIQELKEGRQPPVAESQEVQERTDQISELDEEIAAIKAESWAKQGDAVAQMGLANRRRIVEMEKRQAESERAQILTRQYDRLPEGERDEAVKAYNKNRHLYGDLNTAHAAISSKSQAKELQELRARLAALEKGPDPEVTRAPVTHGREISAKDTRQRVSTQAQWQSKMKELDARIDDGDAEAHKEKMRLQLERRKADWIKQ